MQTKITHSIRNTADGQEAEKILRACVHCGFCTATCPTYQLLGDELDGPRGRIYQIKQILEGDVTSAKTRGHLDRCLTCRSCETTCPSGVNFSRLVDIGRPMAEALHPRVSTANWLRKALTRTVPYPERFGKLLRLGQTFRPLLPRSLKEKVPVSKEPGGDLAAENWPGKRHERVVAILSGCVQPMLAPDTDVALAKVLDHVGISPLRIENRCCGALPHHLNDQERAETLARETIDLLWPAIESGCEAVVSTASGCGVTLKEYDWLLRHDSGYREKTKRVSELAKDPVEVLEGASLSAFEKNAEFSERIAFHPPCTLQHGMKLQGRVEALLTNLGFQLTPFGESHLCCGSAGTYSLLEPEISSQLRERKLKNIMSGKPSLIATANIGCQSHLQQKSGIPVVHWLTLLERSIRR